MSVLALVPDWPALRGSESAAIFARAVKGDAGAVLAECDASHAREVEYATGLGLRPTT